MVKQINEITHFSIASMKVAAHNRNGINFKPNTLKQNDSFNAIPENVTKRKPIAIQTKWLPMSKLNRTRPIQADQVMTILIFLS